jgi:hypothetical protein
MYQTLTPPLPLHVPAAVLLSDSVPSLQRAVASHKNPRYVFTAAMSDTLSAGRLVACSGDSSMGIPQLI